MASGLIRAEFSNDTPPKFSNSVIYNQIIPPPGSIVCLWLPAILQNPISSQVFKAPASLLVLHRAQPKEPIFLIFVKPTILSFFTLISTQAYSCQGNISSRTFLGPQLQKRPHTHCLVEDMFPEPEGNGGLELSAKQITFSSVKHSLMLYGKYTYLIRNQVLWTPFSLRKTLFPEGLQGWDSDWLIFVQEYLYKYLVKTDTIQNICDHYLLMNPHSS